VNSLDGTFVANIYAPNGKHVAEKIKSKDHASKLEIGEDSSQSEDHSPEVEHIDFSEEEIVAEHAKKESEGHMQAPSGMNAKQVMTNTQVHKHPDSVAGEIVEKHVRTMITHNKGASWDTIKAPTQTSKGKKI
jgi:hypothetical protein